MRVGLGHITSHRGERRWPVSMPKSAPTDPYAALRTRKYVALLLLAAVLGVVISFSIYWFLKLVDNLQTWVFTDLPNGLGFDGEPPWWPLLPLAVAGIIVGATIRY